VTEADVDVPAVAKQVVNSVRDDHACSPTGKVVVERKERFLRPHAAFPKKLPEMFLRLGIHGKHGIPCHQVLFRQLGNPKELCVTIRTLTAFQHLLDLPFPQSQICHPVSDDWPTDRGSHHGHRVGNLLWREIRPQHILFVGITGDTHFQHRIQILLKFGLRRDFLLSPGTWATHPPGSGVVVQLFEFLKTPFNRSR
jgi:hypothetical protein